MSKYGEHVLVGGSHRRDTEDGGTEVFEKGDTFVPTEADMAAASDKLEPVAGASAAAGANDELLSLTVPDLEEALEDVDDLARLAAVREHETRMTAVAAINARIVELAGGDTGGGGGGSDEGDSDES